MLKYLYKKVKFIDVRLSYKCISSCILEMNIIAVCLFFSIFFKLIEQPLLLFGLNRAEQEI